MLSLNDIVNVGFRKSGFSGYRMDDVDEFVDKVKESYEQLLKKCSSAEEETEHVKAQGRQNAEKVKILSEKITSYTKQEDDIKNALIGAQKLGDASVREARHRAEIILKDANMKANQITSGTGQKIEKQKETLEFLKNEVSNFRSKLLNLYKQQMAIISELPSYAPEHEVQPQVVEPQTPPEIRMPKITEQKPEPEIRPKSTEEVSVGSHTIRLQSQVTNFDD